jgi:hypothetical protein
MEELTDETKHIYNYPFWSPCNFGMVRGGPGASIGEAHLISIRLDNRFELVEGVFLRNADKNIEMGQACQADLPVSLNVLNCDS